ncbi:MAG: flagellar hook-length control protein FliK, partial [Thermodesulfobacteriota bacterium]|nr:flagellar hook-length control protein FliK [Thermodesulfobacteriota bacterium]
EKSDIGVSKADLLRAFLAQLGIGSDKVTELMSTEGLSQLDGEKLRVAFQGALVGLEGLEHFDEKSDIGVSKADLLRAFLAQLGIGSDKVTELMSTEGLSQLDSEKLRVALQGALIRLEGLKQLEGGSISAVSREDLLKTFLSQLDSVFDRIVHLVSTQELSQMDGEKLKEALQEFSVGLESVDLLHGELGLSVSRNHIFKEFIVSLGRGSERTSDLASNYGPSLLNGNELKDVFQEAGVDPRGLDILHKALKRSFSGEDVLREYQVLPGKESRQFSTDTGEYGVSVSRDDIWKRVLVKAGMNPRDAEIFIEEGKYGKKGQLEDTAFKMKPLPLQDGGESLNNRVSVMQISDTQQGFSEGKGILRGITTERVLHQIVEKIEGQFNNGRNVVTMDLKPEFLGRLRIRISIQDHHVIGRIITESPLTKEIIESNSQQLKLSLMDHGLKVDKFSVFVGNDQNQPGQDYERSPFERGERSHDSVGGEKTGYAGEEDITLTRSIQSGQGSIDFFA